LKAVRGNARPRHFQQGGAEVQQVQLRLTRFQVLDHVLNVARRAAPHADPALWGKKISWLLFSCFQVEGSNQRRLKKIGKGKRIV
jgi:hypothetical protein